jgi:hypothetical protein
LTSHSETVFLSELRGGRVFELFGVMDLGLPSPIKPCELACLVTLQPERGIDVLGQDLVWRFCRHLLDSTPPSVLAMIAIRRFSRSTTMPR